jgi:asparagine synthase (glutamine-hydrolysing)
MVQSLVHRGPDDEGFHIDPAAGVFLGFRRLAILDAAGGRQPMWNEDGSVGVVFNGEIYNHAELRTDLLARGHVFRSHHSDTEVLVHGYEQWGSDLPRRLNGMFAFAVYDRPRRRLFLARDRFGEKPLYYVMQNGLFAFASELTALRRHSGFRQTIRPLALQKLFAHGFLPAPNTLYEQCHKLPGGSHLTLDLAGHTLDVQRYWRFRIDADPALGPADEPRLIEELQGLLQQAVRRRLISDVPLGLFLSGGIDSSTVLAFTAQCRPAAEIKTFTIGFAEPSYDESANARALARQMGTEHREQVLDLAAARNLMMPVLSRLDEPLGDASILPTYMLSEFTRRHVTVALSGDGGDELFAGYDPFQALAPAQLYHRLVPRPLHRALVGLADLLPVSGRNMSFDFKVKRALRGLSYPPAYWNPVWLGPADVAALRDIFEAPARPEDLYSEALGVWDGSPGAHLGDRTLEFFTNFYLQDDILTKVDRAAMMVSLESRAVFLDNDLVAFCQKLPYRFKYRNGQRKVLLKKAVAPFLPAEVLTRRKKGFGIPLTQWLREIPQSPPLHPVDGMRLPAIQRYWLEHRAGKTDHRALLWSWLSLQATLGTEG